MVLVRSDERDIGIVFVWGMAILTFPLGLLAIFIFGALSLYAYETFAPANYQGSTDYSIISLVVIWLVLVVVGYFQWFGLVPWLLHKWRKT